MKRSITFALIFHLAAQFLHGYSGGPPDFGIRPEKPLANLVIEQWSTAEGLISNNLTHVLQTSDGFIWITSFNGAMRFDGDRFELFDKDNIPNLRTNGIYSINEDPMGRLWFCTQSSGVLIRDGRQFSTLTGLGSTRSIRIVRFDSRGRIWIGSSNGEVLYGSESQLEVLSSPQLEREIIWDITEGPEGRMYIATGGRGILEFDEQAPNPMKWIDKSQGLPSNSVQRLLRWDGGVLIATSSGLVNLNEGRITHFPETRNYEINDILVDRNGLVWLAMEQGLGRLDLGSGMFETFSEEDGLPANQLSALCSDREGSMWISSKKAGLLRLKDGNITNYTRSDGLSSNNVNIIVEDQGVIYVGTDDGKVFTIFDKKVSPFPLRTNLLRAGVRDICFDGDALWIGSYQGLLRKTGETETLFNESTGLPSQEVRRILKDRYGNLWIGTRSGGVLKRDKAGSIGVFDLGKGLFSNYILAIEEDTDGAIVVGTNGGGLSIIRPDGSVETHHFEAQSAGMLIFNIHVESAGQYWLSTNSGIYHYRNGVFSKVTFENHFKAETFFDLIIDHNRTLWLTSNIGILQASLDDLYSNLAGELKAVPVKLYDQKDGMYNRECTGATRAMLDHQGSLWVPTLGGAVTLHPDSLRINTAVPPVYVTHFRTDFDDMDLDGDEIIVSPGYIRYFIGFTALSFYSPGKVQFRYRLNGFDPQWIEAGNRRSAEYTNLPPGKYSFQVIASNNDGYWNERGAEFNLRILPALYQTKGFYLLLIALAILLVWLIYMLRFHQIRRRNRELQAMNQELDRFVYAVSHDLRAPLNSIMGLVDVARLEQTAGAKDHCLELIKQSTVRLENFIVDLIDLSRNRRMGLAPSRIKIRQAIEQILNDLKFLDKEHAIQVTLEVDGGLELFNDPNRFELIMKNLISNAIKYHDFKKPDPWIRIWARSGQAEGIELKISDNGSGIEKNHLGRIFEMYYRASDEVKGSGLGLHLVKEAVAKMKGKIEVESVHREGTTFHLHLPSVGHTI